MKQTKPTWYSLRPLVVCFLLFSFISSSFNLPAASGNLVGFSVVKKIKGPSHSDNGFPVDDQEKELEGRGEDKCESNLVYADAFHDALLFIISFSNLKCTGNYKLYGGNANGVPIYITKRALLI